MSLDQFFAFFQCSLKKEAALYLDYDFELVGDLAETCWTGVEALSSRGTGTSEKWVPFHTVLGVHEMFLVELYSKCPSWWTSRHKLTAALIFRSHCKCDLFEKVQLPFLKKKAFWKNLEEEFAMGSPMEKEITKFRAAGGTLQTNSFLIIPERLVSNDDENLILNLLVRSQRIVGLAHEIYPILEDRQTSSVEKFFTLRKKILSVRNFGDTWVKMLTVVISIFKPELRLLETRCEVGVGAAQPLKAILEEEGVGCSGGPSVKKMKPMQPEEVASSTEEEAQKTSTSDADKNKKCAAVEDAAREEERRAAAAKLKVEKAAAAKLKADEAQAAKAALESMTKEERAKVRAAERAAAKELCRAAMAGGGAASSPPVSTLPASAPPASTSPASTPPASTPPASTPPARTPPVNTSAASSAALSPSPPTGVASPASPAGQTTPPPTNAAAQAAAPSPVGKASRPGSKAAERAAAKELCRLALAGRVPPPKVEDAPCAAAPSSATAVAGETRSAVPAARAAEKRAVPASSCVSVKPPSGLERDLLKLLELVNTSTSPEARAFWDAIELVEERARSFFETKGLPMAVAQFSTPRQGLSAATLQVQLCEFRQFNNFMRTRSVSGGCDANVVVAQGKKRKQKPLELDDVMVE